MPVVMPPPRPPTTSELPDPSTFVAITSPTSPTSPRRPNSSGGSSNSSFDQRHSTSDVPWTRRSSSNSNGNGTSNPSSSAARRLRQNLYSLRRTGSGAPRAGRSTSLLDPRIFVSRALTAANKFLTHTGRAFLALSPFQRVCAVVVALLIAATSAAFLAYSHKIFVWLRPAADTWRQLPAGWLIVFTFATLTAFPPLFGYSTAVTISGFLYGFPAGWPVVATANVVGSTLSLILCRTVLSGYVHRVVGDDHRFIALGQVLRRDGLGMLTMIRVCPLPYSLSNGFLAQVPSIGVGSFALATALSSPKLLVHVFIGSRLALLADEGDSMSTGDRLVNYLSMAAGGIVGLTVGWLVYRRTMNRAAELAEEEADLIVAAEAGVPGFGDEHNHERGELREWGADGEVSGLEAGEDDISLWNAPDSAYRDDLMDETEMMNGGGRR